MNDEFTEPLEYPLVSPSFALQPVAQGQVTLREQPLIGLRNPPAIIPWHPTRCFEFQGRITDACERRANDVCIALCHWVDLQRLRTPSYPPPIFLQHIGELACAYDTRDPTIGLTMDSAIIHTADGPIYWVIAEAHDLSEGHKYYRCWRNLQAVFRNGDWTENHLPRPSWNDIADALLYDSLDSRHHPCWRDLGWAPGMRRWTRPLGWNGVWE